MKKLIFILPIMIVFFACQKAKTDKHQNQNDTTNLTNTVEVIYFHGKQRCPTCLAIETETKQLLDSVYAKQLADKKIVFKVIDISEKENQSIAEKYNVTWSSLFVNYTDATGKETPTNLTEFAFGNARNNPDAFKAELKRTIDEYLEIN